MKKITISIMSFLCALLSYAQVTIGAGTNEAQAVPIEAYFGYTYSQSIYLQSEVNAGGDITSIQWYFSGTSTLTNTQDIVVWMAHTTKTQFDNGTDWVDNAGLTQVYAGTLGTPAGPGWITVTFDTPFTYNNTDNLLVVVDENTAGWDTFDDDFYCSAVANDRSIWYRNDNTNPDPVAPPAATGTAAFIPNVILGGITQACPTPSALGTGVVGATSAELTWTENGSAAAWNIELVDITAGGTATGTATETGVTNPYTVMSLAPANDYEYYVQADCGGPVSAWAGPFAFSTECVTFTAPYSQDFENAGAAPLCWSVDTGAENWVFADDGGDHVGNAGDITGSTASGGYYAYVDASGTDADAILLSPLVDVSGLTTPSLSFYIISDNEGNANSQLDVDVWDGAAWNLVATYNTNTTGWELQTLDLSGLTFTGDAQVRYTFTEPTSSDFYDDIAIDDFMIDELPSCIVPGGLSANATSLTEATISWSAGPSAETAWNYEYGVTGFTQGTGTTGSVATTPTVDLTMLTAGETYDFYVQADCGGGDTSNWIKVTWTQPSLGETCAAPIDLTVVEDCSTETPYTMDYTDAFDLGEPGSCAQGWQTNTGLWFSFEAPFTGAVVVNTSDSNEIVVLDSCGGTEVVCNNPGAASHEVGGLTPGNTYYLAVFKDSGPTTGTSEICIEAILCSNPSDMVGDFVSNTSAILTWTENGSATDWDVEWKAGADFTPGNMEEDGATSVTTNPTATLSPLTSETEYYVYYRSSCFGGAVDSDWIGPFVFTTACDPIAAPYTQDFENAGAIPTCWSMGGGEDWLFNLTGPNNVGSGGTLSGNTASDGYYAVVDASGDNGPSFLTTRLVDVSGLTSPTLTFYEISDAGTDANSQLDVEVWDGAAWNLMNTYNTNTNGWELRVIDLSGLTFTGPAQARFTFSEPTPGDFADDIAIDDVSFNEPPACIAAEATVAVVLDCANSQFSLDVDVTSLGDSAAISIANDAGVAATTGVNALGVVTVGPFALGAPVEITLVHESDTDCDRVLGTYDPACPPSNDECEDAIALTVNPDYGCGVVTPGTTVEATASPQADDVSGTPNNDVWFTFVATSAEHRVSLENVTDAPGGPTSTDMGIGVYDGTGGCGALVFTATSDPNSLDLTGLTIGNTYYVRVYGWSSSVDFTAQTTFDVCVGTAPSCFEPTGLAAQYGPAGSADISWVAPSSGTAPIGYNWEVVPTGSGQGVSVVDSGSTVDLTATATGLMTDSVYDLYVQSDCGGGDTSIWAGPFTFNAGHCESVPSSIDGNGITNVQIGTTDFVGTAVSYENFIGSPVEILQDGTTNLQITFETGYTYDVNVWIDFNDDFVFEATEQVFDGMSTADNPTTFDASFTLAAATLGTHRMRIGTADSGQATPNPCYNGSWGVTVDMDVDVVVTLGVDDLEREAAFTYYPNPVNDMLTLNAQNAIENVTVYNMLGQAVLQTQPNAVNGELDMSRLESGAYFVEVTISSITKTIRIIKQ